MKETCYVYWYHLPEHVVNLEGYIGVSNDPKNRYYKQKYQGVNAQLQLALKQYDKGIVQRTILCKGTREYCLEVEKCLRPKSNIGWNICKGGYDAPDNTGKVHSTKTKKQISISNIGKNLGKPSHFKGMKNRWNKETKALIGSYHIGVPMSNYTKQMIKEKNSGSKHNAAKAITLYHISNPTNLRSFSCIRIAADELNINYQTLRSTYRLKTTTPNRQGWVIVYT